MTNKEFANWFVQRKPTTNKIAEKNASALRNLLRLCQEESTHEAESKHSESINPCDNYNNVQQAMVKVPAKVGKNVLREVFELAKETGKNAQGTIRRPLSQAIDQSQSTAWNFRDHRAIVSSRCPTAISTVSINVNSQLIQRRGIASYNVEHLASFKAFRNASHKAGQDAPASPNKTHPTIESTTAGYQGSKPTTIDFGKPVGKELW